mmetsp:Transcript_39587/g.61756  ORF Transcript_39587/g.61756 Transcript_39587/m.61756 type:complete len:402 (+) Transcript_39587:337-1542(+)
MLESCIEYFLNLPPWAILLEITSARNTKSCPSSRSSMQFDGEDLARQKEDARRLSTLVTPRALGGGSHAGRRPWNNQPFHPNSGALTDRPSARTTSGIGLAGHRRASMAQRGSLRTAFEADRYIMTAEERDQDLSSFQRSKQVFSGKQHNHRLHKAESLAMIEPESEAESPKEADIASKPPPPLTEDLWGFKSKNRSLVQSMTDLTKGQWKSLPGSFSDRSLSATRPDGADDAGFIAQAMTCSVHSECVEKARKMHQEAAKDAGKVIGANGRAVAQSEMWQYSRPNPKTLVAPGSKNPAEGGTSLFNPAVKFGTKWRRKALKKVDYVTIDGNDGTAYEIVKNGMELLAVASDIVQDGRIQRGLGANENFSDQKNVLKDTPWSNDFYINFGSKNPVDIGLRP